MKTDLLNKIGQLVRIADVLAIINDRINQHGFAISFINEQRLGDSFAEPHHNVIEILSDIKTKITLLSRKEGVDVSQCD